MIQQRRIYAIEFTVIILLWTLAAISPLLFMNELNQNWRAVHVMWVECSVVGVAYIINRGVLMPRLFFSKRYYKYVASIITLFVAVGIFVLYFDGVNLIISLLYETPFEPPMPPIMEGMPFHDIPPQRPPHINAAIIPPSVTVLILIAIVLALDLGLRIAIKWIIAEQRESLQQRERIATQLSNLQSQVSPHFFMNTLNNIHALVDLDTKRAKQTIIELSSLMDYLLYESSNKEQVALHKELDFICNYINLMRLRFSKQVTINFSHSESLPSVKIPPLLFLNFIENSFKYGVDYEQESFINIRFDISDTFITMTAINSNHAESAQGAKHGLGISNSRKRLDLIYGQQYSLDICDADNIFAVTLKIPIL